MAMHSASAFRTLCGSAGPIAHLTKSSDILQGLTRYHQWAQTLTVTVTFHALALLCVFAAVVFAATAVRGWRSTAVALAGFAVGALSAGPAGIDPALVAGLTALVAAVALTWPRRSPIRARGASRVVDGHWIVTSASCGLLAAIWATMIRMQGLPAAPAYAVAAAVPALSAWLAARRPEFAPPILRDEALLAVIALGIAVAAGPSIADGWRSAMNLTVESGTFGRPVPAWTLALASLSLASGGAYALWSRR